MRHKPTHILPILIPHTLSPMCSGSYYHPVSTRGVWERQISPTSPRQETAFTRSAHQEQADAEEERSFALAMRSGLRKSPSYAADRQEALCYMAVRSRSSNFESSLRGFRRTEVDDLGSVHSEEGEGSASKLNE